MHTATQMTAMTALTRRGKHLDAIERYDSLCDFVHHNLEIATLTNSGSAVTSWARTAAGGGAVSLTGDMTITQYEYRVQGKGHRADR
jgi:hypothetical protein